MSGSAAENRLQSIKVSTWYLCAAHGEMSVTGVSLWLACQSSHSDHFMKVLGTGVLQKTFHSYFHLLMFKAFDTCIH